MIRILGTIVALVLVALVALPFARDAYHRYQVAQRLKTLLDEHDQAAWRDWTGDAISFGRSLYARCQLTSGQNASNCEPYRVAIQ